MSPRSLNGMNRIQVFNIYIAWVRSDDRALPEWDPRRLRPSLKESFWKKGVRSGQDFKKKLCKRGIRTRESGGADDRSPSDINFHRMASLSF